MFFTQDLYFNTKAELMKNGKYQLVVSAAGYMLDGELNPEDETWVVKKIDLKNFLMKLEGIKSYQARNFINCYVELGFIKEEGKYYKFPKVDTSAAWITMTPGTAAYCLKFLSYDVFKIYCYLKYQITKYLYNHRNDLFNSEPYLFSYSSVAKDLGMSPNWQPNIDKIRLGIKTLISLGLIDCGNKRYIKSIETKNGKVVPVKFIALYSVNEYSEPQKEAAKEVTLEEYDNMDYGNKIMYHVPEIIQKKREQIEVKDVKIFKEKDNEIKESFDYFYDCACKLKSFDPDYNVAGKLYKMIQYYFGKIDDRSVLNIKIDNNVRRVCVKVFGKDYCDALIER